MTSHLPQQRPQNEDAAVSSNVRIACATFPDEVKIAPADLVILSEIGYYFSLATWQRIAAGTIARMKSGSTLLAAHWTGYSQDHQITGDEVHTILRNQPMPSSRIERLHEYFPARSLGAPMIAPRWHVATLVPARDEEALLPRCLQSIQAARSLLPADVSSDLIVCVDTSDDRTFEIAERMIRQSGAVVNSTAGSVGIARTIAAATAIARSRCLPERCWLANTDADCVVPADWLLNQLHAAEHGFMAVAGIIGIDSFAEHDPSVEASFRSSYVVGDDGTHAHVHGANFGVRADAYLNAGGWGMLPTAEDHDLWNRLQVNEHRVISDAGLRVITSGRRVGRAPSGFAGTLDAFNEVAA